MSALRLDSGSVPPKQRGVFWREAVQNVFHVEAETTALSDRTLEFALERHEIGPVSVVVLRGGSQQVMVRDWARASMVHLLFPQTPGGFIETAGARQDLQPGCVYLVNARGPVLIETPERFEHIALLFPLATSELTRSFIGRREANSLLLSGGVAATLARTLVTLLENAPGIAAAAAPIVGRSMVDLFHAALIETIGARDDADKTLEAYHRLRIRQHAQAGLGDPNLSVESIAAAVGLSTRRIHQLFADSDMTLMRWVWSERLAQCRARLVEATTECVRIGDVAYEWGFNDPAHFSRVFRQRYGVSPRQYLQRSRSARAGFAKPNAP